MQAKFQQFMYGFYPQNQLWRVNLVFAAAVILLIPLLIPRIPGKTLNAVLFFFAFPIVAFFLLHGGGIKGFGISWVAGAAERDRGEHCRRWMAAAGDGWRPGLARHFAVAGAGGLCGVADRDRRCFTS